jgi:hypothetical protein
MDPTREPRCRPLPPEARDHLRPPMLNRVRQTASPVARERVISAARAEGGGAARMRLLYQMLVFVAY